MYLGEILYGFNIFSICFIALDVPYFWFKPYWYKNIYNFNIFWILALSIGISSVINNRGQKVIKSNKAAFTGIIVSLLSIIMILLMPAINLAASPSWRGRFFCKKNLSVIYEHLESYADSHDGCLPDRDSWCDNLIKGSGIKLQRFACPTLTAPTQKSSYALNESISGMRLSDIPEGTVLIFESTSGWNNSGSVENMNYENHWGYCGVLKVNGEIVFVSLSEANALNW